MTVNEARRAFAELHEDLVRVIGDVATADAMMMHRDAYGAENTAAAVNRNPYYFGSPFPAALRGKVLDRLEAAHAAHVALDRAVRQIGDGRLQSLGREFTVDEKTGVIRFGDGSTEPLERCEPAAGRKRPRRRDRVR